MESRRLRSEDHPFKRLFYVQEAPEKISSVSVPVPVLKDHRAVESYAVHVTDCLKGACGKDDCQGIANITASFGESGMEIDDANFYCETEALCSLDRTRS